MSFLLFCRMSAIWCCELRGAGMTLNKYSYCNTMECRMENNNDHKVRKAEQRTVHNSTCPMKHW